MIQIIHYCKLLRFHNLIIGMITVIVSAHLINYYNYSYIVLGMLNVGCVMACANIMNDILDLQTDKLNKPNRVLIKKFVSLKKAQTSILVFLTILLILAFFGTMISNIFLFCIIIPLLIMYNLFLKKMPLIGNIVIAFLLSSVFIYAEVLFTNSVNILIIPATLAFNLSLIREIIKDLHDYKGDLLSNMKTLPIVFGIKKTCKFLSLYIIASCIYFFYPYFYGVYLTQYLYLLIFFIEIPLIYSLFLLLYFPTIKTFKHLSIMYKLLTIAGLCVILSTKNI